MVMTGPPRCPRCPLLTPTFSQHSAGRAPPLGLDGDSMGIMGVAMSVSMVCWDMGPLLVDDVPSGN